MPHELKESPEAIELSVTAPTREELFREALAGILEVAYSNPVPEGIYEGRVVPVQAAGSDDDTLLAELADDTLRAVRDEKGALQPPRWLAFDDNRVTATLPLRSEKAVARPLLVSAARVRAAGDGWNARLEFQVSPGE